MTPFFGREEVGLLHALAALADLSLARCVLAESEQAGRVALQHAMEEAERANTAKSDFVSRMSHELRTPLNVVLGFGQILEMKATLDDGDREAVEHILKAGHHLLGLINEVLDLATIESGRMAISPEPVEVAELVSEALALIRPLADDRSVRLTAELEPCQRHVIADRQRLKQVLLNLYSNAVKYNRDGGEMAVSCAEVAPGRLRLQVRDTGPGVPAALMDRLFEPFDRLGAESRHIEGTGLGLALSRQLVELMGGEIGVESREGEGSVFWVELAITHPPGSALAATSADSDGLVRPSGRRQLLLIEDNLANLKVVQRLMAGREHIEVLPAMTGGLGMELAREHRPDVILLDQHLPDVPGVEVLHRLKAHPDTRDIPVVIVSADATPGQVRRMREIGADDYVTKPLDLTRFLTVIDGLLDAKEATAS
jgi:signal transduction histidine kinase/ActR/RegA family two-component response regulator